MCDGKNNKIMNLITNVFSFTLAVALMVLSFLIGVLPALAALKYILG